MILDILAHYGYETELPKGVIWENPETFINVTLSTSTGVEFQADQPNNFTLLQNYPNPFNASTIIRYTLPQPARVQLKIYNLDGKLVRTLVDHYQAVHTAVAEWNGKDDFNDLCASGMYLYELNTENFSMCRKMLLLK
jgi:hypothetical protein